MIRRQYHRLLQTLEDKGYYRLRALLVGFGFVLWAAGRLMWAMGRLMDRLIDRLIAGVYFVAIVAIVTIVTSGIEVYILRSVLETAILNNTLPNKSIADAGLVDWFFGLCIALIGKEDYLDWLLLAGDNLAVGFIYVLFYNRLNSLACLMFFIALATDKLLMFILWKEGVFSDFHEVLPWLVEQLGKAHRGEHHAG